MAYLNAARLWILACMVTPVMAIGQPGNLDMLQDKLTRLERKPGYHKDTAYINTLVQISFIYADSNPDSALQILSGLEKSCRESGYQRGEADVYKVMGNAYQTKGNFEGALAYYEKSDALAEKIGYKEAVPGILNNIGLIYLNQGNYPMALQKFYQTLDASDAVGNQFVSSRAHNNIGTVLFYQKKMEEAEGAYLQMLAIAEKEKDTTGIILAYNNIGEVNVEKNDLPRAIDYFSRTFQLATRKQVPNLVVSATNMMGDVYVKMDSSEKALSYYEKALLLARQQSNAKAICKSLIGIARVQTKSGEGDKALDSGLEALKLAGDMGQTQLLRDAYEVVSAAYESLGQEGKALASYKKFKFYADSLQSLESERIAANYQADKELSEKEQVFQRRTLQLRWLIFSAFAALASLAVILWIINRNRQRLSLTYKDLQQKNKVIEAQKIKAEDTLSKLRAAQAQLIQSEKMASLGELTAGIAHEIQNPLNFVNNFSEINAELIDELRTELSAGNLQPITELAEEIRNNSEKINHHGKRAEAIVKSMLQHSRSSSGQAEPTDINTLADEYLRLAYHGLRAKDKSFNASFETDFTTSLPSINIIRQDIGRVILNLISNAFYAVNERSKTEGEGYKPTVIVSTRQSGDQIQIAVQDNGGGIPEAIREKIFQPFFSTKPTGQGTGLGLSLSYDIIKAHGGEIKLESEAGKSTVFTILLPVK